MPQISLYIDEKTLKKVETAAMKQHVSISKWVAEQIRSKVEPIYPAGFFDLYGSLSNENLIRPSQHSFSDDSCREKI